MSGGKAITRGLRGYLFNEGALSVLLSQQPISQVDNDDCPDSDKVTSEEINELTKLYGGLLDKSPENVDAVFTEVETSFAKSKLDMLRQLLKSKLPDRLKWLLLSASHLTPLVIQTNKHLWLTQRIKLDRLHI